MTKLSLEKFENGVEIYQDESLYKFTSDAIRLAKFCNIKPKDHVLDMCAGCGVVGLYAYSIQPFQKLYFNDIQPEMCDLIEKNIAHNGLGNIAKVYCKDLNLLKTDEFDKPLDVVVCNPPYFKLNGGKINTEDKISICRHEIATNISTIIKKAGQLIKSKGKFYMVIPSDRLCEAITLMGTNKFECKRIKMHTVNNCVNLCLIEAVKDGNAGVKIELGGEND